MGLREEGLAAIRGAGMFAAVMTRALDHAEELNRAGVDRSVARLFGFSPVQHSIDCGYDPREVYDLLDTLITAAGKMRRSLGIRMGLEPTTDLPRVATIPVNSDELHLLIYSFTVLASELIGDEENAAAAENKFIARAKATDTDTLRNLAATLTKLHDSVCTGDN